MSFYGSIFYEWGTGLTDQSEFKNQEKYIARINELLPLIYGDAPGALIRTYGCQQNVADSERIRGILERMGFGAAESENDADLILFNTCAVREHAEDRVFGNVGALSHFKKQRPGSLVILCGCMTQQPDVAEKLKKSYPHVDLVFGTHLMHRLPEFIYRRLTGSKRIFDLGGEDTIVEGLPKTRDGGAKGFLSIMYGCNNFCTYCIVPYVRGRERSRLPEDIISEAEELIADGVKDITLLGQNVNSYGKSEGFDISFPKLLQMLNALPGDFRIRFMTSHPKDLTDELIAAMAACEKVANHIHLPVQSGSDRVLASMNRHYTSGDYLLITEKLKTAIPDITFSSDIIVGFPGETEAEFDETLELIEKVGYAQLFMFIYSKRGGTPAADMTDPVTHAEKVARFKRLEALETSVSKREHTRFIGTHQRVLCEEYIEGSGTVIGRTSGNLQVEFAGNDSLIGAFAEVSVTGARQYKLVGKLK